DVAKGHASTGIGDGISIGGDTRTSRHFRHMRHMRSPRDTTRAAARRQIKTIASIGAVSGVSITPVLSRASADPRQNSSPVDFRGEASDDPRMLELLIVIGRALALALRGHQELVLENLTLRQQLMAMRRTTNRPQLQTCDRLFWITLARIWRNWRTAVVL